MDFYFVGKKSKRGRIFEEIFSHYLLEHCSQQLIKILKADKTEAYYALLIDFMHFYAECPRVADGLMNNPIEVLKNLDAATNSTLRIKCEELCAISSSKLTVKKFTKVRVHNLPLVPPFTRQEIPSPSERNFMSISATVLKRTDTYLIESSKEYSCSKCSQKWNVAVPLEKNHKFPDLLKNCPNKCVDAKVTPSLDLEARNSAPCSNLSVYTSYQEIKVQERVKKDFGAIPGSMWVILEQDLCEKCKPGDDVLISGVPFLRWKKNMKSDMLIESELCFYANHINVTNEEMAFVGLSEDSKRFFESHWDSFRHNPFEGRNLILSSFCPQIYGMYVVKLALCVILGGGVSMESDGNRVRGASHMLLVGDPGTGKSELLTYVSSLLPRSVMTTGVGTSSAGLTAAAVRESGEWTLEGGALVLADGGVCAIDEFSAMGKGDRTSILEAMEQQCVSVAKAGIVTQLPTRCSIIGATNPLGKYDPSCGLGANIGLETPLLSRFDIVLVLRDAQEPAWDEFVADFILDGKNPFNRKVDPEALDLWDKSKISEYFSYVKSFEPVVREEANLVLRRYFSVQRATPSRDIGRTTVRLFESLLRLSEGHARLMCRNEVRLHDAIVAITLIDASMQSSPLFATIDCLHTNFPTDPMEEYSIQAKAVLFRLDLEHLWPPERKYLEELKLLSSKNAKNFPKTPPRSSNLSNNSHKVTTPTLNSTFVQRLDSPSSNSISSPLITDYFSPSNNKSKIISQKSLNLVKKKISENEPEATSSKKSTIIQNNLGANIIENEAEASSSVKNSKSGDSNLQLASKKINENEPQVEATTSKKSVVSKKVNENESKSTSAKKSKINEMIEQSSINEKINESEKEVDIFDFDDDLAMDFDLEEPSSSWRHQKNDDISHLEKNQKNEESVIMINDVTLNSNSSSDFEDVFKNIEFPTDEIDENDEEIRNKSAISPNVSISSNLNKSSSSSNIDPDILEGENNKSFESDGSSTSSTKEERRRAFLDRFSIKKNTD